MSLEQLAAPGQFETVEQAREARLMALASARRSKLLKWSAPFVAVAAIAAIYLLAITAIVIAGERNFASHSYASSVQQFSSLQNLNILERWKPYYITGTARYASGAFFAASRELNTAMELVPKGTPEERGAEECMVATNLSLTYEGMGDEAARANDPAMALNYYEQALTTIAGCGQGGGGSEEQQEQAQEAQERQEGKQEEQQQQQEGEGDPTDQPSPGDGEPSEQPTPGEGEPSDQPTPGEGEPSGSPTPGDGEPSASPTPGDGGPSSSPSPTLSDQEQELQDRNREAQEQRERDEQSSGGGSGGGQGW